MPRYTFACDPCRESGEVWLDMDRVSDATVIHRCNRQARRVFGDFYYQEDRVRFYRNPRNGTRHSSALGMEMPESRRERDAICKQKGIEFITKSEIPSRWTTMMEHTRAFRNKEIEKPLPPETLNPPERTIPKGEIMRRVNERGIKLRP